MTHIVAFSYAFAAAIDLEITTATIVGSGISVMTSVGGGTMSLADGTVVIAFKAGIEEQDG